MFLGALGAGVESLKGKQTWQKAAHRSISPHCLALRVSGLTHLEPQSPQMSPLLLSSHHSKCFSGRRNGEVCTVLASLKHRQSLVQNEDKRTIQLLPALPLEAAKQPSQLWFTQEVPTAAQLPHSKGGRSGIQQSPRK